MRSRVRAALARRIFERRLHRLPVVPRDDLERLGDDYGAWSIPVGLLGAGPVCYCLGAGADVSFDVELVRRFGATVRCVDPFGVFGEMAMERAAGDERFSFHEFAIAAVDGPVEMTGRQDDEHGSVSAVGLHDGAVFIRAGRRIDTLAAELGDSVIDLVKLDIEGSEYEVLETHDLIALGVRVLCVEFHHTSSFDRARRLIASLAQQGFVLVHRHRTDLTFARSA